MNEHVPVETRTIFQRVAELYLPLGHYVVIGGIMEAHGIRPARDVDIVTTDNLFDDLVEQGWPPYPLKECCVGKEGTRRRLEKGDVQINNQISHEGVLFADTELLIEQADIIQGIPFGPLDVLKAWKAARNREKDLHDIQLIDAYLASK